MLSVQNVVEFLEINCHRLADEISSLFVLFGSFVLFESLDLSVDAIGSPLR